MKRVLVVGSGASAVHFALTALEKGWYVTMVDVGHARPPVVSPADSFVQLKHRLSDPTAYFLGRSFEGVLYPGGREEYYGFPPNKRYVFAGVPQLRFAARGFAPLWSFAQGGLAEAWTGGVYPFNDEELADFPFGYAEIEPYYSLIAKRIGISGLADDLARFMPVHDHLQEPLALDEHSTRLLQAYERQKAFFQRRLNCYLGRARSATISRGLDGRQACGYLGRCLWGCPSESLYTPAVTLRECQRFDRFSYVPGRYVTHFRFDATGRVKTVVAHDLTRAYDEEMEVDRLVLAAGTLSSSKIILESVYRDSGEIVELGGLMDNRQILMPFLNLAMIGRSYNPDSYQYHQLAIGLEEATPKTYVHALITTLKTALIHPIVQSVPFDLKLSMSLFRNVHAALGLVNINFADVRRSDNVLTLEVGKNSGETQLVMRYTAAQGEVQTMRRTRSRVARALRALGCVVPPGMTHERPMGASVHYSGTLPMHNRGGRWTTSADCRCQEFENVFIVDGTTFPFLPAKNLTFTLMANAARVADVAF
jgi:choline dehydrogenase-like flavoprotein